MPAVLLLGLASCPSLPGVLLLGGAQPRSVKLSQALLSSVEPHFVLGGVSDALGCPGGAAMGTGSTWQISGRGGCPDYSPTSCMGMAAGRALHCAVWQQEALSSQAKLEIFLQEGAV